MQPVSQDLERTTLNALQQLDVTYLNNLLDERPDIIRHRFRNRGGRTLLHLFAQDGCTPCLKKILDSAQCEYFCAFLSVSLCESAVLFR